MLAPFHVSDHPHRVRVLRAGSFRLDGGGMFGAIPRTFWSKWLPPDDENRVTLAVNCLLVEDGPRRVIVETGYGAKWNEKERGIYEFEPRTIVDALAEVEVEPDSIDAVVVTHLHFDHAAGLTRVSEDGSLVPVFPRAEILVQRREWEDALANRSTMTRTYLRSHLDPIRDRVRTLEGACEPISGIAVQPFVGHTWGQQGVAVRDERGGLTVFPGDLIPTAHHVHLSASMGYDMLPYENMILKREFLTRAVDDGWRVVLDHDPIEPVVRVSREPRDPERFRLSPW